MTAIAMHPDGLGAEFTLENPELPHQVLVLLTSRAAYPGYIAVSCNCLSRDVGRGRPRPLIEARQVFPAAELLAAWRAWHVRRGIELCPECGSAPASAAGNADAGIIIFTCPSGHSWARTNWDWERKRP